MSHYLEQQTAVSAEWSVEIAEGTDFAPEQQASLEYLLRNIAPGVGLAIIGKNACVPFKTEEWFTNEEAEEYALEYMKQSLTMEPDFQALDLDDGGAILLICGGLLWAYLTPEQVGNGRNGITMERAVEVRDQVFADCRNGVVIGVVHCKVDVPHV